jgi:hypothetical protein
MSVAEDKAALNVGVTAIADPTGRKGILYRGAASTSNTALTLPVLSTTDPLNRNVAIAGRWINIYAKSTNVQYAFGVNAAPTLTYDPDVAIGTGLATAGATVPAGQVFAIIVPSDARFLSIISESATSKIEIYVSEGPG